MKQMSITKQAFLVKFFLCVALFAAIFMMLFFGFLTTAFASERGTVLTINTAINDKDNNSENEDEDGFEAQLVISAEPEWVWHPISVTNEPMNGFNAVRRTYALPPDVNPAVISTADFEMFGQQFTFAYVIQQQTSDESFIEIRETVTIEARSRNLNDILPNLEQEIRFERDGFAGTLVLDLHSITSEVAETSRHTTTATRQRTYPNLLSADNSLIPRTITDGGTTFHLSTVDWQSNSISVVDGHTVASSFTANATYTAQVTQTRTTGYTITAEYVGTVFRTNQGKTLFTAVFYGEPIIEIWLEEPEQDTTIHTPTKPDTGDSSNSALSNNTNSNGNDNGVNTSVGNVGTSSVAIVSITIIATLIGLGVIGAGGFFLAKHLLGYNVTVYSIDSPREIIKAGKIKMDINLPEPTIILDKAVGKTPAKTDRYIIQIAQRAVQKLIYKDVRVVLHDKEAIHRVPEKALGVPIYEFEVNFSDDDTDDIGVADGLAVTIDTGGYPFGGDDLRTCE